jgi:hypothetical protein
MSVCLSVCLSVFTLTVTGAPLAESGACMMVLLHILAVLCETLSVHLLRLTGRKTTHCTASKLDRSKSSGLPAVRTPKTPVYEAPVYSRHFAVWLWMSVGLSVTKRHLCTDAVISDGTCQGVHWLSWRPIWAFIINSLSAGTIPI